MNTSRRLVAVAGLATAVAAAGPVAASTPPDSAADSTADPAAAAVDLGAVDPTTVRLDARAALSADFLADDIPTGAFVTPNNGREGPFDGHIIPGFSGVVDAGDGTFWALPDNGFGAKDNSGDFELRLYHVTPEWQTAEGGSGEIVVGDHISLADPDGVIGFPIVNEDTPERLLTGGDLDIESVQRTPDGTFWIGEEFGPFILHFDADGVLLDTPIEPSFGMSPQNPHLETRTPRSQRSGGFEGMALSPDGTTLYPIVENSFSDDGDKYRRFIYEVDIETGDYTGNSWQLRTEAPDNLIGDAQMIDEHRMIIIERDNFGGIAAAHKRLYIIDLDETDINGFVTKHLVVDLLEIANPDDIVADQPAGSYGLGVNFEFPLVSVESVVVLADGRLLVANDNNYPGDDGRLDGTPDDTEMIILSFAG